METKTSDNVLSHFEYTLNVGPLMNDCIASGEHIVSTQLATMFLWCNRHSEGMGAFQCFLFSRNIGYPGNYLLSSSKIKNLDQSIKNTNESRSTGEFRR